MSYQPNPTPGHSPPPPPPGAWAPQPSFSPLPAAPSAPPMRRGRALIWIGWVLVLVGVAGGAVCIALSTSAVDDTVAKFARAPQGCTTTLEFDHTGTFTLYFERRGELAHASGNCDMQDSAYDFAGDEPVITLSLVDSNGDEVTVDSIRSGRSYDSEHYTGSAIAQVRITERGDYDLSVSAGAGVFAVAVGGDPEADKNLLLGGGVIAAVVGGVAGLVLVFIGRSRRRRTGGGGATTSTDRPMIPVQQPYASVPERPSIPVGQYTPPPAARPPAPTAPPAAPTAPPTWGPPTA